MCCVFIELLLLFFIILKLTNYIDWSWWWVLSPLWIPIVFGILVILVAGIMSLFVRF